MPPSSYTRLLGAGDREYIAQIDALRTSASEGTMDQPGAPTARIPNPQAINDYFARIVNSWEPHIFSPEERHAVRLEGLRYLIIAHQIEEVQRDIYPRRLPPEVESQLIFARQSYKLRYFRLFRINDLPTEIISNIIRFVIWDSMKRPVDARLSITWTCRRWREIALSDSTLWNAIWFRGAGVRIDRAWAWFERARQAPLDIRIDGHPAGSDDETEGAVDLATPSMTASEMRRMLLRLFVKLSSIRMLIIVVDDWKSALMVLNLLEQYAPQGVPLLTRFELHRGGLRNDDRKSLAWPVLAPKPFLGGAVAPCLAYLSLNGIPVDWARSTFENLTTFDIRRLPSTHSPDPVRFRQILASCPRLLKLSMDGAGPQFEESDMDSEPIVPVDLPNLRTLVIADFTRHYAMFLFSQFTAPNVNDLTLMNLCGDDYLPLFQQLTGAFPKVRLLTAYSLQFDPAGSPAMTRWLDSMPLLAYLRVANVANVFFGLFFRHREASVNPVAPHLTVVDCQSTDPNLLVQWVQDRHQFGTPLKKIYVSEELGHRLDQTTHVPALTSICTLAKLPRGATTPEEEALSIINR